MFWKLKIENLKIQDEIEKLNSENVIKSVIFAPKRATSSFARSPTSSLQTEC